MGCSGSRASGPMTEEEKLCVKAEDSLPLYSLQLSIYESIINKHAVDGKISSDKLTEVIKEIMEISGYKPKEVTKSVDTTKGNQTVAEEPKHIRGEELLRKLLSHTFFKSDGDYNAQALMVPGVIYCKGSTSLKAKTLFDSIDFMKVGVIMFNSQTTEKLIQATLFVPLDLMLPLSYPETNVSETIQSQEYRVQSWSDARKNLEKIIYDVLFYNTSECPKDHFINKVSGSLKFMLNAADARGEALRKIKSGDQEISGAVTKSIIQNQAPSDGNTKEGTKKGSRRGSVEETPVGIGSSIH